MLRVGFPRVDRDGVVCHVARKCFHGRWRGQAEAVPRAADEITDAHAQNRVRQGRAFDDADGGSDKGHSTILQPDSQALLRAGKKDVHTRLVGAERVSARRQHMLFKRRNAGDMGEQPAT